MFGHKTNDFLLLLFEKKIFTVVISKSLRSSSYEHIDEWQKAMVSKNCLILPFTATDSRQGSLELLFIAK